MDGKALAERIRGEIAEEVRELGEIGLATVLVGDDPASDIYIRLKHKAAGEVGINAKDIRLASQTTEEELLEQVAQLNADDSIDGLLVQLPLPDHIDEGQVLRAVSPRKDVDGFHPASAGQLYLDEPTFVPATPLGIMALLEEYGVPLEGKRAVVIGRSTIVGKPAALLLLRANATVTICHSRTADLAAHVSQADVLVAAVGKAGVVSTDMAGAVPGTKAFGDLCTVNGDCQSLLCEQFAMGTVHRCTKACTVATQTADCPAPSAGTCTNNGYCKFNN